jgi:hypothetical protein
MARFENERLEAVFGDVALVREGAALRLRMAGRADVEFGEAYAVVCQVGPHVVVTTELGATLDILDLVTGTRRRVERDGFGCWGLFASPSPDGSSIAIGCALAAAPKPRPPDVPLDEWLARLHDGRPLDDRNVMVFISAGDWTARIVTESFGNFAGLPAWTDDGAALTFAIPFENRVAWVAAEHPRRLDRVRTRLDPLLDATELVGRGIR